VVWLVVAVELRGRLVEGSMRIEPVGDSDRERQLPTFVRRELGEPTSDLVREVIAVVREISETARPPVDCVDRDERVDELLQCATVCFRCRGPLLRNV